MSFDSTPVTRKPATLLYIGDRRLKRIAISIRSKKNPEEILPGYALLTELNDGVLSFFSTQKFLVDEVLNVRMIVGEDQLEFQVCMSHLHEQISSGRVMTSIPTEESPFPARKFYRCFARVLEMKKNGQVVNKEGTTEEPTAPVAVETPVATVESIAPVAVETELKAA